MRQPLQFEIKYPQNVFIYNCLYIFVLLNFFISFYPLQFPSELEPWKLLQEHILSDYVNHEVNCSRAFLNDQILLRLPSNPKKKEKDIALVVYWIQNFCNHGSQLVIVFNQLSIYLL